MSVDAITCRICRDSSSANKIRFECDSDWSSLFEFCFGFQVTKNGPLSFCETCSNKLHDFGDFKHLCLQSEDIWKSLTNYLPVKKIVKKEENIKENTDSPDVFDQDEYIEDHSDYPDIFGHDDNDYNVLLIVKEEGEEEKESLIKNLENKLTEISIKKIENPPVKDEEPELTPTAPTKTHKPRTKNSKSSKRSKSGVKKKKKLKPLKSTNTKVSVKKDTEDLQDTEDLLCGLCDFTATSSEEVNQHLLQHYQENLLNCQLCSFVGKDVAHMVSHRYTHCPSKGNQMKCPACPEKCTQQCGNTKKLEFHYRSVHLETKGGLCIVCGRSFGSYKYWKKHERGHVSQNYICDHCGMSFLQRCGIVEHMITHYDIRKYICDLCGRGFKKASNLRCHNYIHHTEHKKVTCTICNTKFKCEINMRRHMRRQHSEKTIFCQVCSESFSTNSMLRYHMYYYHSDEKPFACELCGARYRSRLYLKIHKRKHTGELPYTCRECGKGFSSSMASKRHQSVHTGVRPIKCLHCDMTFYSKKQMQNHLNSKHKHRSL